MQTHKDPDIEERLQTTIDVWRDDLLLRAEIMAGIAQPHDKLAHERQTYLDKLVEAPSSRHELVHKIGNTLLHATNEEKADFIDKVRHIRPQNEQALGAVSMLATYLEEYHPAE